MIIAFGALAAFSFFAMNSGFHETLLCLGAVAQGEACPEDPVGFAAFHLAAFKAFSTAEFSALGLLQLLLLALLLATLGHAASVFSASAGTAPLFAVTRTPALVIALAPYARWLAVRRREDISSA